MHSLRRLWSLSFTERLPARLAERLRPSRQMALLYHAASNDLSVRRMAAGQRLQTIWEQLVLLGICFFIGQRTSCVITETSFYETLGVEKHSSEQDIKKAYKKAALKYHPDKAPEGERKSYEERFKKISHAYEILSDPEKRRVYDTHGEAGLNAQEAGGFPQGGFSGFGGGGDPFEMFRDMFGQEAGFHRRRTQNLEYVLWITLEELYTGCDRTVNFEQSIVCKSCNGRGAAHLDHCRTCRGSGMTQEQHPQYPGFITQRTCPSCRGVGTKTSGATCRACSGARMQQKQVQFPVHVPPGCPDNAHFVFHGKAHESPDMETGDVIIEVREKKHKVFTRVNERSEERV